MSSLNISSILSRNHTDLALLILRVGIGTSMLAFHGYGKLVGGPEQWERIGGAMANLGIDFFPMFWGFMAMISEFFCSALIILGLAFRPAAFLLAGTMAVAAIRHLSLPPDAERAGLSGAAHALEFMTVFLALFLIGPGKYRLSALWKRPAVDEHSPGEGV